MMGVVMMGIRVEWGWCDAAVQAQQKQWCFQRVVVVVVVVVVIRDAAVQAQQQQWCFQWALGTATG